MNQDYFNLVLQEIPRLFQESASPLEEMGMNLFRQFAVISVAWYAMKVVLNRAFDTGRFLTLLMVIAIVGTILTGYSKPLPGFEVSFRALITNQASDMAELINKDQIQQVHEKLQEVEMSLEPPGVFEVGASIKYYLIMFLLAVAQAATIYVVSYGFLVSALTGLIGPFFIPFLLVPGMDWLFWGWFKSYIQFSFYPVFAFGYTSLLGTMLVHFLNLQLPSGSSPISLFIPLLTLLLVYSYGILKLPSVVSSVFSGRAGEAAGPGL